MNCQPYNELTIVEKTQLIGKAIHLLQSDEISFYTVKNMVEFGESKGLLEAVTILPENREE